MPSNTILSSMNTLLKLRNNKLYPQTKFESLNIRSIVWENELNDWMTRFNDTNPPNPITNFIAEAFTAICQGEFDIEPNLNEKFPQITPMTINEFIQQWWGGKEKKLFKIYSLQELLSRISGYEYLFQLIYQYIF